MLRTLDVLRGLLVITLAAIVGWWGSNVRAEGVYILTDLGAIPGGISSRGMALNNSGRVTGSGDVADGFQHAFKGTAGDLEDLGTLGGRSSLGRAINNSGAIAGESWSLQPSGQAIRGFVTGGDGEGMRELAGFGGGSGYTTAYGLNNAGSVVGAATDSYGILHAALWESGNGPASDLGSLVGYGASQAFGINDQGDIVGVSDSSGFVRRATRWRVQDGQITREDFGSLVPGGASLAVGVNKSGQIAGSSTAIGGMSHAFLYEDGQGMRDLHDASAFLGFSSQALGLNDSGTVVGQLRRGVSDLRAFVWSDGLGMRDLNDLLDPQTGQGWALTSAQGINAAGQIVGIGRFNGRERGFLLSPSRIFAVPEPSTIALLLSGLGATAFARLRKRLASGPGSRTVR